MRSFFLFFFMSLTCFVQAQKIVIPKNRIPVHHPDFFAWVEVYEGDVKTTSLQNSKTYFWLKAKQVHSSKGGYEGDLLHGEYTALYKNDALKEKGQYHKGLKTGEWKEWYPSGEFKLIGHWKKGLQRGTFTYYNEAGKIMKIEHYKTGRLHGRQYSYSDSSETFVRYKKGKLIQAKTRKKKEKVKIEKGKEIKIETDSLNSETQKKKNSKGIFGRNKKQDEPQSGPGEKSVNDQKEKTAPVIKEKKKKKPAKPKQEDQPAKEEKTKENRPTEKG